MKRFAGVLVSGLVLSASIAISGASAAPAKFIPAKSKAIADQYIVVLKDGPSINAGFVASEIGAKPLFVYDAALNGFAAKLNQGQLKQLQKHPEVAYIEQDAEVSLQTPQEGIALQATQTSPPWGLDRIDQHNLPLNGSYSYNSTASNVTVYMVDTGILAGHTQFGGRAAVAYDTVGGTGVDCIGHGTHVAGTVGGSTYGVAKGARLRGVRVLDCNGSGTLSSVVAGINWVANNAVKPAVVTLWPNGPANSTVDSAATNLVNRGIVVVVGAGDNNADACNYSPARASGVITVAASDRNDVRAPFSNYGPCVELYAPGVNITSAWIGGTATNTISSTSAAAAHVAGVAAQYLSTNPSATPSMVSSWIITNATPNVIINNPPNTPNRLLYKAGL